MNNVRGIVLYDTESDNTLNGVYTNNDPSVWGTILGETARLVKSYPNTDNGTQLLEYDCFYFDFPTGGVSCTLLLEVNGRVYKAKWLANGKTLFEGEGFKMNERQIAISYWSV
ncbi:hypothetical protein [Flavobacterium sp.]|uniref:hypothetical protein n=1 Tax=Flavobacterium sp. TaxID=239 RepID=UPI002FDEF724